ncbi:probable beta-1,4-xylosyltransferase IRX9H [Impatiens glandulifera]|uniref:probable beta-1,4-xylosyltransferase IRX9H n=1 Tax=Impatiens glandulifera TaxID=253017 RepID=UPI001FB19867|nr:probable beta-1,4-xylosyltransferase IRX9H [Impatiens glandulifera]
MASIRRTLSPLPRPGSVSNGEAVSLASPLSRSSSAQPQSQSHHPPIGVLSSLLSFLDYLLYRIQYSILGLFSNRSSRPLERSKLKGQIWRRYIFHFIICFAAGIFLGLTPFASTNLFFKQHQSFSFDTVPPRLETNSTPLVDGSVLDNEEVTELVQFDHLGSDREFHKLLIVVTPTDSGPFQAYRLNRLGLTLKLVRSPLLWIVVDLSSQSAETETADILRRNSVMYRHLVCTNNNLTEAKDKRVHQRNTALSHIEKHRLDGIVYFADEENIYSVDLFEDMRKILRFGTWTVARLMERTDAILEGPVCNETRVIGWHVHGRVRRFRRFHSEMPGFAFNSTILWDTNRWHRPTIEPIRHVDVVNVGDQASFFIAQVVEDESQMECLQQNSSKVLVWQHHSESSNPYPPRWHMKNSLDVTIPLA